MGLTIHYRLQTPATDTKQVRSLVDGLRRAACALSFQEVGPVEERRGRQADYEATNADPGERWLKIQASRHLDLDGHFRVVKPLCIIAFTVRPGDGCEPASFGFCQYPSHLDVTDDSGCTRRHPTHLDGWRWHSFCKTQYASDPNCGGIENFLRCHVSLVKLLDAARATEGITVDVDDESHYWDHRQLQLLIEAVDNYNQFVAAFSGIVKDQFEGDGISVEAPIAGFPNFEHLEAKGRDRLFGRDDND